MEIKKILENDNSNVAFKKLNSQIFKPNEFSPIRSIPQKIGNM